MDHLEDVLADIRDELRLTNAAEPYRASVEQDMSGRKGSRYIGPGGSTEIAEHLAAGGTVETLRTAPRSFGQKGHGGGFGRALRMVAEGKALAESTGSSGGYLVPVDVAQEVTRLLRAKSAVMRLGPRVVPLRKQLSVVDLSTGSTAYYVAENARATVSEPTFAERALLTPKTLIALVPVSTRLLKDADESPAIEEVLREDFAEVLALRADLAFMRGSGTGGEILGIRNTPGLTPAPSLGANGGPLTWDILKQTVATLRGVNAGFERPGWILNSRTLGSLEMLKLSTGEYYTSELQIDSTGNSGRLLGYPFVVSNQLPNNLVTGTSTDTSEVYFSSDWQEAWLGDSQSLEIEASGEASYTTDGGTTWISAFQNSQVLFRASLTHDLALRRPQLFTVLSGVRAS